MPSKPALWQTLPGDTEPLLGIPLPGALKPLDLKGVYQPGINGLIFQEPEKNKPVQIWKIEGLKTQGGIHYLTCESKPGTSLFNLLMTGNFTAHHLKLLLSAINQITTGPLPVTKGHFTQLSASGTFFTDDGGLLLLPDEIIEGVIPLLRGESPLWDEALKNPVKTGPANLLFGWAVLAYRTFTGAMPFPLEGEEKVLPLIRGFFEPVTLKQPGLNSRLVETIHAGLSAPENVNIPELASLFAGLIGSDNFFDTVSEDEKEKRRAAAKRSYSRAAAGYTRKRFIRRKGSLTLILIAGGLLLGSLLYTFLSGFFAPPLTRGWSQDAVVAGFYHGINDLDLETVDACETNKAGKSRVDLVTNLYAISRMRMGYEMKNPYINAERWVEERPSLLLEPGEQLYGPAEYLSQTNGF